MNKLHLILCLITSLTLWGCPEDDVDTPVAGSPMGGEAGGDPVAGTPMGGTPMGGEPAGELPPIEEITAEVAETFEVICEFLLRCDPEEAFEGLSIVSQEECVELLSIDATSEIYESYQLALEGRVEYQPETITCIRTVIESIGDQCASTEVLDVECEEDLFVGTVAEGEACEYDGECQGRFSYCEIDDVDACVGTCVFDEDEGECTTDEECVMEYGEGYTCIDGDYCGMISAVGESCEDSDCVEGSYCNDELTCVEGPRARLAEGEPCRDAGLCEAGLVCPALEEGTCQAPAQLDEACTFSESTLSFSTCDQGLFCSGLTPDTSMMGVCQPTPSAGEPCGEGYSLRGEGYCPLTLFCVEGTCTAPAFEGQSCSSDEVCVSGPCVDGVCERASYCEEY